MANTKETAVFGGGCFWCTEAVYSELKGVLSVMPGYAGGAKPNPTYEEVCGGATGHAEVIKIEFDPAVISYDDILTVFFATHDPTTLNRQGSDVGTQYRSIVLYMSEEQKQKAEAFIAKLNESGAPSSAHDFSAAADSSGKKATEGEGRVVTEVKPFDKFYEAEDYHRNYYKKNQNQPYCQLVISPKLEKLKEKFYALLKESEKK